MPIIRKKQTAKERRNKYKHYAKARRDRLVQVVLWLEPDTATAVDNQRGGESRQKWITAKLAGNAAPSSTAPAFQPATPKEASSWFAEKAKRMSSMRPDFDASAVLAYACELVAEAPTQSE